MIMLTCFLFAGLSAKMRATTSMLVGTVLVVIALTLFGLTNFDRLRRAGDDHLQRRRNAGQPQVQRVPRQHRAAGQEGDVDRLLPGADPDRLDDRGQSSARSSITSSRPRTCSRGSCWSSAACRRRRSPNRRCPSARRSRSWSRSPAKPPQHLTQVLYQSHHVGLTWYVFAAIGVASAVMIYLYGRWILKLARQQVERQQAARALPARGPFTGLTSLGKAVGSRRAAQDAGGKLQPGTFVRADHAFKSPETSSVQRSVSSVLTLLPACRSCHPGRRRALRDR